MNLAPYMTIQKVICELETRSGRSAREGIVYPLHYSWTSLVAQMVKNPPAMWGLVPGLGRSPGEGNGYPLQYSGLENSMDRGVWRATVHGVLVGQDSVIFHIQQFDEIQHPIELIHWNVGQLQQPLALISWKSAPVYIIKDFCLKNFKNTSQFKKINE